MDVYQHALDLLHQMLGPHARFRDDQWTAIETVAIKHKRVLVIQRTGWGKSITYFLSTKLLREQGSGPTLLVSPLLSLMRNQIEMAERIGIRAATIHSANRDEWDAAKTALIHNTCDVLLISPERLANQQFREDIMPALSRSVGLFVVDEAHCISDWGHDFRPDYRRIVRVLNNLPRGVPVMGTTATANNRVVADVQAQLGADLEILRGPLTRASLRLQNIRLADQGERLAWLVEQIPHLPGSGIVYCLTVADAKRVAEWLLQNGIQAMAYYAEAENRVDLEQSLLHNRIKVLVATVALGMGFDKPDLGFVIHFQRPGSVVHYYQQVGRAGRAVDNAYGILLSGQEDDEIQEYFIETAFPPLSAFQQVVAALEAQSEVTMGALQTMVNLSHSVLEKILKLLEVDGIVGLEKGSGASRYFRTANPWRPDIAHAEAVTALRRQELKQMQAYVASTNCLMEFLSIALDDPHAARCGKCANCTGQGLSVTVSRSLAGKAVAYLKHAALIIEPRKQWPSGLTFFPQTRIEEKFRLQPGRALCTYGDAGWGKFVRLGKYNAERFDDALVTACVELIRNNWRPAPSAEWVTAIPSQRRPKLVYDFAGRLARALGLPFAPVFERTRDVPEQKKMANSAMQVSNVWQSLILKGEVLTTPVLLVDDIVDSRWTMVAAGYLLSKNGSGPVFPFALASASQRDG